MKQILKKMIKAVAYMSAAIVIMLAIAVGVFRLMLPQLPEYQEEIKDWASAAIGMSVEFSGMNARWRLSGPELSFFDAALEQPETGESLLQAEEVSVGVGLLRLIADRELVVDRVSIRNTAIDLRQNADGDWLLQGVPFDALLGSREMAESGGNVEIIGQNIDVQFEHPASGQIVPMTISSINASRLQNTVEIEADIDLTDDFGSRLEVSAIQLDSDYGDDSWRLFVSGESLVASGWSRLRPAGLPEIDSGVLDISLWLDLADGQIQNATSNLVVTDLHALGPELLAPFGLRGSFEYSAEGDGWLLGANQFRLSTAEGDWPESTLQVRVTNGPDGEIRGVRANASYFDLDDLKYTSAWLTQELYQQYLDYAPAGIVRALSLELSDLRSGQSKFDVNADLQSVGIAAVDDQPGVREFSGNIRADRDGGRVEIESTDLQLDLGKYIEGPIFLEEAFGTVIWRRNRDGMTVLSDSVRIRNADFDSQMSLQISLPEGNASPVVDYESTWSVTDVSAMHQYFPRAGITPKLRQWLTDALVSGRINQGTTRFSGALDQFPFDDGNGTFRIEARLEDATLVYSDKWPAPEFRHLDLIVDGSRLYSHVNSATNLGNAVNNARIEIADLRTPVLSIEAFATGTLESIKSYVANSPIDDVLGGQVERVDVAGDASFELAITFPIQDQENYDFSTRVRVSDGMLRVRGFAAPITELNGLVGISRNDATSEELFGRFLGQTVNLKLERIGGDDAPHSVLLNGVGFTTAAALQAELGVPIAGVLEGGANYEARVRFPNGRGSAPGPLQIEVNSDLVGFQSDLPVPLHKQPDQAMPMTLNIEFPAGKRILAAGSFGDDLNWQARFLKADNDWDFDRGALAVGGEALHAAEVRGMHIYGNTPELDLHAWLAAGRRGDRQLGLGERIRSINLDVTGLYAVGQKYTDHNIAVNRGGNGWLVKITGEEADGLITVPYDFNSGRAMTLNMERLILPGNDETESGDRDLVDPRLLPGISVHATEFGIGARRLGEFGVDFQKTNRGLEATNLKSEDKTFTIAGNAGWVVDRYEGANQRTFFDAEIHSTNVQETFSRLDYDAGIIGDDMRVDLDVGWTGGPRKDFMTVLNGTVSVALGAGRLADVEPGAGRVFGLMSFVALPRRLALDFRDVFDSGFSFDEITGKFRLENGEAYTCDLTVAGTSADVGIVGRTGLASRDYYQSAIVSANVGNTLPVVGGIIGGPQVAAALFVFSQIFKKPLKDVGQAYYSVDGSWDDPVIDRAGSQRFVETSSLAGCIDATQ